MLRKIILTLALVCGIAASAAPFARAQTDAPSTNTDCLVEGNVDLRINGTDQFGSVSGWIGNTSFYGRINAGHVHGNLGAMNVNLYVDAYGRQDFVLSGWIANTSVRWMSFGNWFNTGYVCIQ